MYDTLRASHQQHILYTEFDYDCRITDMHSTSANILFTRMNVNLFALGFFSHIIVWLLSNLNNININVLFSVNKPELTSSR